MKYLILATLLFINFPALAQTKTVAIPIRLQKADLSPSEQLEMQNYGEVPMTAREIIDRQTEMLLWDADTDNRNWRAQMDDLIQQLPDHLENIIDVLTPQQRAALPLATKNLYDQKKTTRGQKP